MPALLVDNRPVITIQLDGHGHVRIGMSSNGAAHIRLNRHDFANLVRMLVAAEHALNPQAVPDYVDPGEDVT